MKLGPTLKNEKPKRDLRKEVLQKSYEKKKFENILQRLREGEERHLLSQLTFNEKRKFEEFVKEKDKHKIAELTAEVSNMSFIEKKAEKKFLPGFHKSPRMLFKVPAETLEQSEDIDMVSIENPFSEEIHSTASLQLK